MTAEPRNSLAIGLILASVTAMAFADAVVKALSGSITLWQIFATRSAIAVIVLLAMMAITRAPLRPRAGRWAYIRGALLVATWLLYYASLPLLNLSTASVAMYIGPILIVLFAGLVLGDRISKAQWAAIGVGFLGVVTITRPGTDGFNWAILLPITGAACYAGAMLMTRVKCRDDDPLTLSFSLAITMLIAGMIGSALFALPILDSETRAIFPFVLNAWGAMTLSDWAVIGLLGLLIALYPAGVAKAYQVGTSSVVATFDYAYLISAAIWGFIFFAETPDRFTIVGMVLITMAGLLALRRGPS